MRGFLLVITILLVLHSIVPAQSWMIKGRLLETETDAPVSDAEVTVAGLDRHDLTDEEGFFEIKDIPYGMYRLIMNREGYDVAELSITIDKPSINLEPVRVRKKTLETEGWSDLSTITLDLEDENKDQNISGLLRASEDIFVSTAGYTFGNMFFRPRGYDSENTDVMINGYEPENRENGRIIWSNWGGLNDAMRNKEIFYGLSTTPFSFSSIGGLTYINTRPSQFRKQIKVSYSLTDRTYNNRLMLTTSTGLMKNGWALTFSGSRRWAQEGYVEGTFYDAWAYFGGIEKKLGARHSIGLTVFGAPIKRGQQAAAVQEAFDLRSNNYYNPYWGYQMGEKRNARIKQFHNPVIMLNHFFDVTDQTRISTAAVYSFGTDRWSALTWYNAPDPRPDYYRYLPSYQTDTMARRLSTEEWQNDPSVYQINWDKLYQINYLSNLEHKQARYILEDNITRYNQFSLSSRVNSEITNNLAVSGGLNVTLYKGNHYKEIKDMLGGNFWVDIDQYAQRDFPGDSSIIQNDLNHPNRVVYEGDKFGYDYDAHINNLNLWGQTDFSYNKVDFYLSGMFSWNHFWRTGYMKNGRHPDNSYGNSARYDFFNFGFRGGITYKITGRHYALLNGIYMTKAPYFTNSFISPKTRDNVVPDIRNEKIYGGDVNYVIRYPWLYARFTYYYILFRDQAEVYSFYHDDLVTYVNYSLTGVDKRHQGIEFGAEAKVTSFLSLFAVAALGDFRYTSRPLGTRSYDNGSKPDTTAIIYLKNFFVPGTPQTALSGGLKFNYKFWFVDINANYYDNNWLDFNPERRTQEAIDGLGPGDPLILEITREQKLAGGFTLDASIGKSFLIKQKVYINLNFSMTNILNNKNIQSGGYEQNRFDYETKKLDKFPPKYYYYFGRTFFFNISVRI